MTAYIYYNRKTQKSIVFLQFFRFLTLRQNYRSRLADFVYFENQTDLLDKLEGYLNHINSDDFKVDYPQSTVYIDVTFQEMPHVHITDLLFKCIPLCKENGAVLRVKIGEDYYSFI